jgi:hypothetical protein
MISTGEITSPNSEPGSEHEFGSRTVNPTIQASNHDPLALSYGGRARANGAAVMNPSRPEPQADRRKVRFSSPLAPDPEDDTPDDPPVVLVPNSSDQNLASRVSPDPSNHVPQFPSPPPFPSPRLLFTQSHPRSLERTLRYHASALDSDREHEPREGDALVPPITVSTQFRTADDNRKVVSGGLRFNNGKNMKGREETENVDQHQPKGDSLSGSQDPAETRSVQGRVEPQGVRPHGVTNIWESDTRKGEGIQQSPAASQPTAVPENSKPMGPLKPHLDSPTNNVRRVESEARSRLQAEVEGDEEGNKVTGTSKEVTASDGPPHSTPFPPLGRVLSLLDETGPPRSADGFGRAITRRPRRPIGGRGSRKRFQTQPPVEVESGWQSDGTPNANARPGAGVSKSDDLSFFAGL